LYIYNNPPEVWGISVRPEDINTNENRYESYMSSDSNLWVKFSRNEIINDGLLFINWPNNMNTYYNDNSDVIRLANGYYTIGHIEMENMTDLYQKQLEIDNTVTTLENNIMNFDLLLSSPDPKRILLFSHPDGRTWKLDGEAVRLNTGVELQLTVIENSSVYKNEDGFFALYHQNTSLYLRHGGYRMFLIDYLIENHLDFAWKLLPKGNNTYDIFNDYGGGWYVGYWEEADEVRIVVSDDSRRVDWSIIES
jgi:hypothetical protein